MKTIPIKTPKQTPKGKRSAALAGFTLAHYIEVTKSPIGQEAVTDLICDLRHYCEAVGINFELCEEMAFEHYRDGFRALH